jgi:hypothetical protein
MNTSAKRGWWIGQGKMSKAKVIAKIQADGGQYTEGKNFDGEYVFEAWLPNELIWDNDHQTGSIYAERGSFRSMADLWKDVFEEVNYPVKEVK